MQIHTYACNQLIYASELIVSDMRSRTLDKLAENHNCAWTNMPVSVCICDSGRKNKDSKAQKALSKWHAYKC